MAAGTSSESLFARKAAAPTPAAKVAAEGEVSQDDKKDKSEDKLDTQKKMPIDVWISRKVSFWRQASSGSVAPCNNCRQSSLMFLVLQHPK